MELPDWNALESQPRLSCISIRGQEVRPGDRVRLWPRNRADIMDMFLEGQIATIEAIEQDYEHRIHLAVVIDDDPGRDLGLLRQVGHRFFYLPEDVEPLLDGSVQAGSGQECSGRAGNAKAGSASSELGDPAP